jgi:DNA-binding SARP family transcriptional activator
MDMLWPDLGSQAASNNLRGVIHTARRTLEPDPSAASRYLTLQDDQVALCPEDQLWVDVEAFEEAAAAARRSQDPAAYRMALELYAGELLPEDRYEEWVEKLRMRLQEANLSLLLGLARLYEEHADYDSAIETLRTVVAEEPTREEAHVGLMRLYALSGSRAEALAQYGQLDEVLIRELGTEPAASSRALRDEIAARREPPQEAPSLGSPPKKPLGASRHNLPDPRTSFVGREGDGMSRRTAAAWFAWSLWAFCVAFITVAQVLDFLTPSPYAGEDTVLLDALFWALSVIYVTVGTLIAARRPENPIGWIFFGTGLIGISFGIFAQNYAVYALMVRGGALPGWTFMAWVSDWTSLPLFVLATVLLLLLFPAGRLQSRWWRIVVWMVIVGSLMVAFGDALAPRPLDSLETVDNPVGIGGVAGDLAVAMDKIGIYISLASVFLAAASLIIRLVRARGKERQQLKWFAFAAAMLIGGFLAAFLPPFSARINEIGWSLGFLGFFFPVAVGIAILRYHLYDIDIIINRTLVYGSLTATLVAIYFGGVATSQVIIRSLTGQAEQLVVVASTLVIAALFNPLRRRIQAFIDRRFYRSKYDARKTLEEFSVKLRDETDLEALNYELMGVVRETMQPSHVSLWLRSETASKGEQAQ